MPLFIKTLKLDGTINSTSTLAKQFWKNTQHENMKL